LREKPRAERRFHGVPPRLAAALSANGAGSVAGADPSADDGACDRRSSAKPTNRCKFRINGAPGDASASPGMRAGWRTAPQTAPAVVALECNLFTTH